ncbi:aspartate/glutamate racemase family protein [Peptoniphilus sp. SGI.035]|uniref:aspartate/glutamate racemase family protein n=1 Tax=Peptoniphilus sp. SGI.035 TaxID=3420564 RepID=UPI003D04C31B
MKVGVFAGTFVDTKMGVELLKSRGFDALSFPISKNPKEQSYLQYYSKDELTNIVEKKIVEAKNEGAAKIFIYCNSLSAAIDVDDLTRRQSIEVITPFDFYKNLDNYYKDIVILAANSKSAHGIDKIISEKTFRNTISIGMLSIVEEIEKKTLPRDIVSKLGLKELFKFFNAMEKKPDAIILACTHFPYMKEEFKKLTDIEILDPAEDMINKLKSK